MDDGKESATLSIFLFQQATVDMPQNSCTSFHSGKKFDKEAFKNINSFPQLVYTSPFSFIYLLIYIILFLFLILCSCWCYWLLPCHHLHRFPLVFSSRVTFFFFAESKAVLCSLYHSIIFLSSAGARPAKITEARNGNRCCSPPIGSCAVKELNARIEWCDANWASSGYRPCCVASFLFFFFLCNFLLSLLLLSFFLFSFAFFRPPPKFLTLTVANQNTIECCQWFRKLLQTSDLKVWCRDALKIKTLPGEPGGKIN